MIDRDLFWGLLATCAYEAAMLALLTGHIPAIWLRAVLP